ncbi:uncharacterized protein LOC114298400 [Camellia sinensis]|uniref:uncharacterized protein LOC114298400 n=1 Tax=Camellia sinensis TaxID=4442 RepID=UPI0010360FBB|nr:uncharacterized protein LOC114298400 [Camellia sinensis]
MKEFNTNGRLAYGLNSSFITLVPKKDNPVDLVDFRPISLVNSMYRILAKVLSHRLKKILPRVISEMQIAFIGGRCILDGVMIDNEVIEWWKSSQQRGVILKLDFEKAYNSVNWGFLFSMLSNFEFGEKWLGWIKECLSTSRISVLVNGSPTDEFSPQKGLRQGNHFSPFLFNLVIEGLNMLLTRAQQLGLFKGANVGSNGMSVSHLQFADDTIIFCEADLEEIFSIKRVLRCFEVMSGLRINFYKSVVCGIGVSDREVSDFATVLNCSLTLIKSVVCCLPSYYISIFKMLKGVVKSIEKLQARFLWRERSEIRRKVHLVGWKEVSKSKSQGGLGVKSISDMNANFLLKWWWRYGVEDDALWKSIVCSMYGKKGKGWWPARRVESRVSPIWQGIAKDNPLMVEFYLENAKVSTRNGERIKFWIDKWCNNRVLKEEFPRLFQLSVDKKASVMQYRQQRAGSGQWNLRFRRQLRAWEEEEVSRLRDWLNDGPVENDNLVDLWKLRNEKVFIGRLPNFVELVDLEKSRIAFWAKSNIAGLQYSVQDIGSIVCWVTYAGETRAVERFGAWTLLVLRKCCYCNVVVQSCSVVAVFVVDQMALLYVSVVQMVADFAAVSGIWECLWRTADLSV